MKEENCSTQRQTLESGRDQLKLGLQTGTIGEMGGNCMLANELVSDSHYYKHHLSHSRIITSRHCFLLNVKLKTYLPLLTCTLMSFMTLGL